MINCNGIHVTNTHFSLKETLIRQVHFLGYSFKKIHSNINRKYYKFEIKSYLPYIYKTLTIQICVDRERGTCMI